jgi:hypothetical protein
MKLRQSTLVSQLVSSCCLRLVLSRVSYSRCLAWWYVQHNYSLEMDDNSARVGGRIIRKGYVRYAREVDSRPLAGGPRVVLSEHASARIRLFGGVIVVPKGLLRLSFLESLN